MATNVQTLARGIQGRIEIRIMGGDNHLYARGCVVSGKGSLRRSPKLSWIYSANNNVAEKMLELRNQILPPNRLSVQSRAGKTKYSRIRTETNKAL